MARKMRNKSISRKLMKGYFRDLEVLVSEGAYIDEQVQKK